MNGIFAVGQHPEFETRVLFAGSFAWLGLFSRGKLVDLKLNEFAHRNMVCCYQLWWIENLENFAETTIAEFLAQNNLTAK
eukprot:TRINITY_DN11449_c0_g1_i1.p1 TRINITY_DN11449_c0_g1~~TRINITY_DN11449_c0_g1_i1.p1  ORF type:complete len:80 (+),score=13.80 TRINITY_DN11449_c0_g1_i1:38-277(+)